MASLIFKHLVVITLFISTFANSQRAPSITYISREQIKNIGDQVELVCAVDNAQDHPVSWIKYDPYDASQARILSSKAVLLVDDFRFSIRFNDVRSTYTLTLKDIQEDDAGWYQCQVMLSAYSKITADVEMQVRIPPIIFENSTRSILAAEGESIQLKCYVGGFPTPNVLWRREEKVPLPTGGTIYRGNVLTIASVKSEDRGVYYCVAENGVGRAKRREIYLQIEVAPVIEITKVKQIPNEDAHLTCLVKAYPPPGITWEKNEVRLSNNGHYSMSNFATSDEFTSAYLRVSDLEKNDYGQYTCKAQNKLGSAEGTVELLEPISSACPPACGEKKHEETGPQNINSVSNDTRVTTENLVNPV